MPINVQIPLVTSRLREFGRFINAGVVSNIAYFASLCLLSMLSPGPLWLHAGVAYLFSTVVNYSLHYNLTFRSSSDHRGAVGRYIPVQAIALAGNSGILYVLVTRLGLHYALAQLFAILATIAWTYTANRNWVFNTDRHDA